MRMLNISYDELCMLKTEIQSIEKKIDSSKLVVDVESSGGCPKATCYGGCAEGYK